MCYKNLHISRFDEIMCCTIHTYYIDICYIIRKEICCQQKKANRIEKGKYFSHSSFKCKNNLNGNQSTLDCYSLLFQKYVECQLQLNISTIYTEFKWMY